MAGRIRRGLLAGIAVISMVIAAIASTTAVQAASTAEFLAGLSSQEADQFQVWRASRRAHEAALDAYWDRVDERRAARKKKRAAKIPFTTSDFVMAFPPAYDGPKLSKLLADKYEKFLSAQQDKQPEPKKELPSVADYLAAAKRVYGFDPERVTEVEFKKRYAEESAALGLARDQVVRVYALETGGIGTYDMQAGIHPIKKTGRPISSALGYAQLLDANSVNEIAKHGPNFADRLLEKAGRAKTANRAQALKSKAAVVRRMTAAAKRVPFEWGAHQAFAKTSEGQGIHALNIDGDVGPMLQAIKLKGLKEVAEKAGRGRLTGGEMELMNLAGPVTGLEMMQPAGQKAPAPNFFARRAYYVNKMVIGLTGEGLLAELNRRMDVDVKRPGSVEFAAAFDTAAAARTAGR